MQDASPEPVPPCPGGVATHVVRNGHNRSGTADFFCRGCWRQFAACSASGWPWGPSPAPSASPARGSRTSSTPRAGTGRPGNRDRSAAAQCLGDDLREERRAQAILCTDFGSAYAGAVLAERHVAAGKEEGLTNHVERFWCTLRQRCARAVRKTLSFSKRALNHNGALWYFIRHYNETLL